MADYLLGKDAVLYHGAADTALGALSALTRVKDVTVGLETGEADVTTRANSGWRATAATLRECTIEFEMIWKSADADCIAVRAAYLAGTAREFAALDQARAVSGAEGIKGNFTITGFSRSEPLEEGISVAVTAKLAKFNEWVVV